MVTQVKLHWGELLKRSSLKAASIAIGGQLTGTGNVGAVSATVPAHFVFVDPKPIFNAGEQLVDRFILVLSALSFLPIE